MLSGISFSRLWRVFVNVLHTSCRKKYFASRLFNQPTFRILMIYRLQLSFIVVLFFFELVIVIKQTSSSSASPKLFTRVCRISLWHYLTTNPSYFRSNFAISQRRSVETIVARSYRNVCSMLRDADPDVIFFGTWFKWRQFTGWLARRTKIPEAESRIPSFLNPHKLKTFKSCFSFVSNLYSPLTDQIYLQRITLCECGLTVVSKLN